MNEAYRVPTQPHFATITWAGGGDPLGAARAVLQTGEMDYAWNLQLAPEVLARMLEGGRGELLVGFGSLMERLVFNLADPSPDLPGALREARARPHPILSDIRVREALSLALDRRAMTEIGFGEMGRPTCNFIVAPPAMVSPNTDGCLVQDRARANALLDAAGWERGPDGIRVKDGRRLELLFQTSTNAVRQDFQALIQQWWREIGVETRLRNIDAGVFFGADPASPDTFTRFRADVQMYANFFEGADPSRHLEAHRCGRAPEPGTQWQGQNINRFCTDTAEALWAALDREPDPYRRAELVIAINDLIVQDFAVLPLVGRVAKVVEISWRRNLRVTCNHPTGGWNRQGDHAMTATTATAVPALPGDDDAFDPIEARLRQNIRATIEALFEEELEAAIGRCRHGRGAGRKGYRHGHRAARSWGPSAPRPCRCRGRASRTPTGAPRTGARGRCRATSG